MLFVNISFVMEKKYILRCFKLALPWTVSAVVVFKVYLPNCDLKGGAPALVFVRDKLQLLALIFEPLISWWNAFHSVCFSYYHCTLVWVNPHFCCLPLSHFSYIICLVHLCECMRVIVCGMREAEYMLDVYCLQVFVLYIQVRVLKRFVLYMETRHEICG